MVCINMLISNTKSSAVVPVTSGRSREDEVLVYVAAVPLRASKGPAHLVMSAAYSLNLWDLQHFIVIINSSSPPLISDHQALVFDFQPRDPENILTALAALSGQRIPGVVQMRKLKKLPTSKCWFVGNSSRVDDAMAATAKFNKNWHTDLRIGHHDCRHYANGLVEYLTGETCVLEHLMIRTRNTPQDR